MNRKIIIVAISILGILGLCLILVVGPNMSRETSEYDLCVKKCENAAFDANVERDDITNDEFRTLMAEYKAYICPGRCERYK